MARSRDDKEKRPRGFGAMDEARQREISSQGGRASAQGNTSNRGFASMDKDKQREISSKGGKANATSGKNQGWSGKTREDEDLKSVSNATDATRDLNSLEDEDAFEREDKFSDASYSETDEDEDEGLGDGKIGRSKDNDLSK